VSPATVPSTGGAWTILRVDDLSDPFSFDDLCCFYLIELEGTSIKEPVWFLQEEVEPFPADH